MKTFYRCFLLALVLGGSFSSCDDDDININSTPEFSSVESAISTAVGETFVFTADIVDEAGVKEVNLRYAPWFLDKTIVKDSLPERYELRYQFRVPDDAVENSVHPVVLTVRNAGGKEITQEVIVSLDADVINPEISIVSPVDGFTAVIGDGKEIAFNVDLTDRGLKELRIASDIYNETIAVTGATANVMREIDVETAGLYTFNFTVVDLADNETTRSVTVNVVDELVFPQMFITGAGDVGELTGALFGAPFTTVGSDVPEETGYVFTARYYAATDNEGVRFIPQKSSFAPYAFGADPSGPGILALGTDASVDPIILSEGPGYYEVKMNLLDLTYSATKYEPTDNTFSGFYMVGQGPLVNGVDLCTRNDNGETACWTFASGKPFTQDPNNPYRFSATVTLAENVTQQFIFTGTDTGWSPFWRVNSREVSEANAIVPGGGVELNYTSDHYGVYTMTADTHLNTLVAVPQ